MDELENLDSRDEIYSKAVRAGKRTYFFDVKATKSNEYYLTLTESKRRFSNEAGKFFYDKHKIFLYREDFEKFVAGLKEVIAYIEENQEDWVPRHTDDSHSDVRFEDLDHDMRGPVR
ncbi:MAG TPA: DUF3276 family protein [Bacteroidales bacterium]|nr:DUF3276 family protein [Bacteroidales bacterium]